MSASRRPLRAAAALLAGLVAAGLLAAVPAAGGGRVEPARQDDPAAGEAPAVDPFDRLAACIGAQRRLLVVLLVDESASLQNTDPDDQRVVAAHAAVQSLDLLRESEDGEDPIAVDVLVSTFSFDFSPVGGWTELTDETRPVVDRRVEGLADRDTSMDTDFNLALDGARVALADRATETTAGAGGEVCKSVLLFTDGGFALGVRETEEDEEAYGTTKPYAPDLPLTTEENVEEVTRIGIDGLCREGGVADAVRGDRITLVTVPLGEGAELLEAITTGRSGATTCGDPDTDTPGVYLPAADTGELLRTFDLVSSRIAGGSLAGDPARPRPCADDDDRCAEGTVTFTLSPSLRRVHVFAAVPGADTRVVLRPPDGDALELVPGTDADEEVDGVPVSAEWITPLAATIDLDVPDDGRGAGEWAVTLVGPAGDATGSVHVLTFSDLVATLTGGALRLGGEGTLTAEITTRGGEASSEEIVEAEVTATLTDPITGEVTSIRFTGDGDAFTATHTVAETVTAAGLRAALRLEATTVAGARLSSVSPEVDVAVLRPDGYPQVSPPRLELSSISGDGTARGEVLLVTSGDPPGCAWLDDLTVRSAPAAAGAMEVEADDIGRGEADCTPVRDRLTVPVRIDAAERAAGSVTGHVRLYLATTGGGDPIATDVPFSFEMARGVDEAKRLVFAGALMLAGMLIPFLLLLLINSLTTRFQPLENVRATRVPVVVSGRDQLFRTDGSRHVLDLDEDDFSSLEGKGGQRSFSWGGLTFRARTPLNPFGEPHATVQAEAGAAGVSREGRRTDLALGLAGSWLFLLDQDASRAAAERLAVSGAATATPTEIHGHLVAFVSAEAAEAQTERLLADVEVRLPTTARKLARVAHL